MKLLEEQVEERVEKIGMLSGVSHVLCGLSGGADSVFLFLCLKELSAKMGFSLRALHVHHGIRGEEADADAEFVKALCEEHGVPCLVRYRDIPAEALKKGLSEEEAGRIARREILLEEAERWTNGSFEAAAALAHHQNDLAESVLFRLARGSGVRGLAAMREETQLGPHVRLIRPLLTVSRSQIEERLLSRGVRWREDSSNAGDEAARNRIRHHILPLLKEEVNEGAVQHIAETARIAGDISDFLKEEALKRAGLFLQEDCSGGEKELLLFESLVREEMPAMQQELLYLALERMLPGMRDIGNIHIKQLRELFDRENGKTVHLPGGLTALKDYGGVRLMKRAPKESGPREEMELQAGSCFIFQNMRFYAEFEETVPELLPEKRYTKTIDYGTINNTLVVRNRKQGDFLFLRKDGGRKTLSDYFTDEKVPGPLRDRIPLVADGSEILWVVGMRLGGRCRVTEETKRALTITAELLQEGAQSG